MGSQTVFIDNANEKHNMILLKHFTEKNQAAVVDIKTRKRKTGEFRHSISESSVCSHVQKNWTVTQFYLAFVLCRNGFEIKSGFF